MKCACVSQCISHPKAMFLTVALSVKLFKTKHFLVSVNAVVCVPPIYLTAAGSSVLSRTTVLGCGGDGLRCRTRFQNK